MIFFILHPEPSILETVHKIHVYNICFRFCFQRCVCLLWASLMLMMFANDYQCRSLAPPPTRCHNASLCTSVICQVSRRRPTLMSTSTSFTAVTRCTVSVCLPAERDDLSDVPLRGAQRSRGRTPDTHTHTHTSVHLDDCSREETNSEKESIFVFKYCNLF